MYAGLIFLLKRRSLCFRFLPLRLLSNSYKTGSLLVANPSRALATFLVLRLRSIFLTALGGKFWGLNVARLRLKVLVKDGKYVNFVRVLRGTTTDLRVVTMFCYQGSTFFFLLSIK
jgi:hypothetical protein